MKQYDWNEEKNQMLKTERDVCFEDVVSALNEGRIFAVLPHPQSKRHPNQKIFVVEMFDYAYLVPFVEDNEKIFFKTIIPSRDATKKYFLHKRNII
jgi:hypothetical protein